LGDFIDSAETVKERQAKSGVVTHRKWMGKLRI